MLEFMVYMYLTYTIYNYDLNPLLEYTIFRIDDLTTFFANQLKSVFVTS